MKTMLPAALAVVLGLGALSARADEAAKKDTYPLTTCVVSGEELGSMGDTIVHQHEGREVRFCCKKCVRKFTADPAKYLAKLDAAAQAKAEGAEAPAEAEGGKHEHHHE